MWGGGKLKLIAVIEEPAVIEKILTHLGLAAPPPRANARGVELFQGVGAEADGFYRCRGGGLVCALARYVMCCYNNALMMFFEEVFLRDAWVGSWLLRKRLN